MFHHVYIYSAHKRLSLVKKEILPHLIESAFRGLGGIQSNLPAELNAHVNLNSLHGCIVKKFFE